MVGIMAACRQIWCWKINLEFYIWIHVKRERQRQRQRDTMCMNGSFETQSDRLSSTRPHLLILTNSSTPWWPSIQIYESLRIILIQNTTGINIKQGYCMAMADQDEKTKTPQILACLNTDKICLSYNIRAPYSCLLLAPLLLSFPLKFPYWRICFCSWSFPF